MKTEIAYIGRSNVIDLLLMKDSGPGTTFTPADLSSVTRIRLSGDLNMDSTNGSEDTIRWGQIDQTTGEITIKFTDATFAAGYYTPYVIVYSPTYPEGLVWGKVAVEVVTDAT